MKYKFVKKLWQNLLIPFGRLFPQFIVLTILCSLFRCSYYLASGGITYSIYIILWNGLLSYVICLISLLFKGKLNKIYFGLIIAILGVYAILESILILEYHTFLNEVTVSAIQGTNIKEGIEMANDAFSFNYISKALTYFFAAFLSYIFLSKLPHFSHQVQVILFIFFSASLPFVLRNNAVFSETPLHNIAYLFKTSDIPNLGDYLQHPQIQRTRNDSIPNIALIIGESHCKSHSSLFGYDKDTNPRLSQLLLSDTSSNGRLLLYSEVESPAAYTVQSFKQILSTYNEKSDTSTWYNHSTIIEVMHSAGYKTTWISNQSKYGLYASLVGNYSELCDTSLFVSPTKVLRNSLDEELISLKKSLKLSDEKIFDIFHLAGSHADFRLRFPEDRIVFNESDYTNLSKTQRQTVMNYDNSLVYNDSVISEIINLYDNKDAVVIYFPDHALDLYESRDDYFGHALYNNKLSFKYGTQIPMLIYLTKSFCEKRPDIVKSLEAAKDKPYNTTNNIYTIMKIAGLRFADNDDVEKYALF